MSLDRDTIQRIAVLSRIRVADEELDHLVGELSNIVDWVETLESVDTEGVPPMTSVIDMTQPLRIDEVTRTGFHDHVLANAPDAASGNFTVPKVLKS